MKKYIYIICFLSTVFVTNCEDYLDRIDENNELLTEDQVWSDRNKINSIAFRLYDTMEWTFQTRYDFGGRQAANLGKNYGNVMAFSGELYNSRSLEVVNSVLVGDYIRALNISFANPDFWDCWFDMWEAIYVANNILDRIDTVAPEVMSEDEKNQIKGEAYLFRAWAYHELSKRWGALPYIKFKILPDSDLNLPRPTYREQITDIVADCDAAIEAFPEVSWLNHPQNMGRMGKAAAMALKSRALTTAASPNYTANNQKDVELWEMAAQAAWDLIAVSQTSSKVGLYQGDYNHIFHTEPGTIEGVWPLYRPEISSTTEIFRHSFAWKNIGGDAGYAPTQELIDKFETADGWPIFNANSGYNEQNPYANRDPRFYKDILYHGAPWPKTGENDVMELTTTPLGKDRTAPNSSVYGNSSTGYLVRKMLPEKYNNTGAYSRSTFINAPYIRMAEIYLNYAEAVNEAYENPNATAPGASLTAVDALNAVRNRVGHVNVRSEFTNDYNSFQKVVRNEFAVELCFEYHSWFDMLRWRTAKNELDDYDFTGMLIIDDATQPTGFRFERFRLEQNRVFDDRNYRYPLREADLQVFEIPNLTQNPGW